MKCVLLIEFSHPKDQARIDRLSGQEKLVEKLAERMTKSGLLSPDFSIWADNSGRVFYWFPFESMEQFAKFYSDKELQKMFAKSSGLLDNIRICLLRPAITFTH